jgi:hypothetical protein
MIRQLTKSDRARARWSAQRKWKRKFIPFGIVKLDDVGRAMIVMQFVETRWSDRRHSRVWRLPEGTRQLTGPAEA